MHGNLKAHAVLTCRDSSRDRDAWTRRGYNVNRLVSMNPKVRDALNELDEGIRSTLASAYAEGKARGQEERTVAPE